MKLGFLGLGQMGLNIALNLQEHGHEVIGWNRSPEKRDAARTAGLQVEDDIATVVEKLDTEKKIVWLMVAAGPAVDDILFGDKGLATLLSTGDIIVDGVNSFYKDTKRRAAELAQKGILLLDCGVSGGITGARNGACVMAGGDKAAYDHIEPILKDMSTADGYGYFGDTGAGHYVKMVHNAIEYGMMQSIAEGLNLIHKCEYTPDMSDLTHVWNHGSIITGNLMGYMHAALTEDPELTQTKPEVGSLGTGLWASREALEQGVNFTTITNAVFNRYQSIDQNSFMYRAIQAMRAKFGGHTSSERPN